jgi:hypothetical protein
MNQIWSVDNILSVDNITLYANELLTYRNLIWLSELVLGCGMPWTGGGNAFSGDDEMYNTFSPFSAKYIAHCNKKKAVIEITFILI